MSHANVEHKYGHQQTHWVPNFKDKPGPVGREIIDKALANVCSVCFFDALEEKFGIRFG